MARVVPPPSRRAPRASPLALAVLALCSGGSPPAAAAVPPERQALNARIAAVRAGLAEPAAQRPGWQQGLLAQANNWTNWPKWSKWSNWANK